MDNGGIGCLNCHGENRFIGNPPATVTTGCPWVGSTMGQAARDPIFKDAVNRTREVGADWDELPSINLPNQFDTVGEKTYLEDRKQTADIEFFNGGLGGMPFYTDTGTLILKPKYPATVNKTTSYDWLVSPVNEPAVDAFVKVEASGRQQVFLSEDVSDANFTIIPAVEFSNPLAGESLPFGSVTTVSWALKITNAYVASLDLEYRIAKGKGWVTIASGLPKTTASQVWNIPTLTRDRPNASLRLVLNDAAGNEVSQTLVPVQLLKTL